MMLICCKLVLAETKRAFDTKLKKNNGAKTQVATEPITT